MKCLDFLPAYSSMWTPLQLILNRSLSKQGNIEIEKARVYSLWCAGVHAYVLTEKCSTSEPWNSKSKKTIPRCGLVWCKLSLKNSFQNRLQVLVIGCYFCWTKDKCLKTLLGHLLNPLENQIRTTTFHCIGKIGCYWRECSQDEWSTFKYTVWPHAADRTWYEWYGAALGEVQTGH